MNGLGNYLKEISVYPLLTAAQEIELGKRVQAGDEAARQTMINSNLRLVVSVAKSFINKKVEFEDLITAGNLGLITAVDKYDPERGFRFSTAAVPWIKQAIMKAIIDNGRIVRIPPHIIQLFNKEKTVLKEFSMAGNDSPTDEQIAAKMKITVKKLNEMRKWKLNSVSLDAPISTDSDSNTLLDTCEDRGATNPADYAHASSLHEMIMREVNSLDDRTKRIIKLRFGLHDANDSEEYYSEHTLEEIGQMLEPQLTRERVRQIINKQTAAWAASGKFKQ